MNTPIKFIANQKEWNKIPSVKYLKKSPERFPCFLKIEESLGLGHCEDEDVYYVAYVPMEISGMAPLDAYIAGVNGSKLEWKCLGAL